MVSPNSCEINNHIILHHHHPPILRPNCRSRSVWQCPFRARCHSIRSDDGGGADRYANGEGRPQETPGPIRIAVSGATELLKVFSSPNVETEKLGDTEEFENSTSSVDDVVRILKSDYEKDYFVTGVFTSAIYTEDCFFEDPTIKFQGNTAYTVQFDVLYRSKALYERNLKLLVPFFSQPSIELLSIEKGEDAGKNFILAKWQLRTYLKFPWRPLISIDGSTVYDLNDNFKVIRHAESWGVSALQAIGQIFAPLLGKSDG